MQRQKLSWLGYRPIRIPSKRLEYAFYFAVFYSLTADIWGISVPLLAAGLFIGVSGYCIWEFRSYGKRLYGPIGSLIACSITLVFIQVLIHGASVSDDFIRAFIISTLQLMLVYLLCLRPGFSYRYPIVLFTLALGTLPFLSFSTAEIERARAGVEIGGGLAHPGGFGEWFGYCAIFFAICGVETKRFTYRVGALVIAIGCILVITLTVGRSAIFGTALALTVAFRSNLKRAFVPTLLLIILAGVVYESGLLKTAISNYEARGMEETGRELLWPAAVERIFSSPFATLFGVGVSNVNLDIPGHQKPVPPHNTFLFFELSSGVIPFAFFVTFWIQALWRAATHAKGRQGNSFRTPYLVFTFVMAMLGDLGFMSPWGLFALSVGAGSAVLYDNKRMVAIRVGDRVRLGLHAGIKSPRTSTVYRYRH